MIQDNLPPIIPPLTVVELVKANSKTPVWKQEIGKQFRIGFNSKQDGLETIWIVNQKGEYCETTGREFFSKAF
jgi:hypothetical protein